MASVKSDSVRELLPDVAPLPKRPARVPPPASPTTRAAAPVAPPAAIAPPLDVERDGEHFRALAPNTKPEILARLADGVYPPAETLNLHRLTTTEANVALHRLVASARRRGLRTLLIIHGRGTHSGERGPVLREEVIRLLSEELSAHVLAFCDAPVTRGGTGATLVRLRRKA